MASKTEGGQSAADFLQAQGALFGEGFSFSGYERDLLAVNRGDGTFLDISGVSGIDSIGDGRGAAFADFDDDGDLDVFLRALHGPGHLLFHDLIGQENPFVRIALEGRASGRDAFGAVVRVPTSHGVVARVKAGGSGFLSQSDPRLLFGLGDADVSGPVEVTWPSGLVQGLPALRAGQSVLLVEGEPAWQVVSERAFRLPLPPTAEDARWSRLAVTKGKALPDLALADGTTLRVADLLGETPAPHAVLNFWATWCKPCREEMPALRRLAAGSKGRLAVAFVSADDETTSDRVPAVLKELAGDEPVRVLAPDAVARVWASGDVAVPTSLVLDAEGRVVDALLGWSAEGEERLHALVEADD